MERDEQPDDFDFEEDQDDDPSSTDIEVDVTDFEPGLRVLETSGRAAPADIRSVTLIDYDGLPYYSSETERTEEEQRIFCRQIARFVNLIDLYGRDGIRSVTFSSVQFNRQGWRFPRDDRERLFREVLPSLPFLEKLHFQICSLPIYEIGIFASELLPSSSLVELDLEGGPGALLFCIPQLAAMIRRNVPIRVLKLNAKKKMDRDACRQFFESLKHNTNMRSLEVTVEEVDDDALMLPNQEASSLRRLRIDVERWTLEGKGSLARQLKKNVQLEELHVVSRTNEGLSDQPWIEMLQAHNSTLLILSENVGFGPGPNHHRARIANERVAALLRRNRRIHQALDQIPGYNVSPTILWPSVLEMVSSLPTLLYKFVRLGDVNALVDLVLARQLRHSNTSKNKKRSRSGSASGVGARRT